MQTTTNRSVIDLLVFMYRGVVTVVLVAFVTAISIFVMAFFYTKGVEVTLALVYSFLIIGFLLCSWIVIRIWFDSMRGDEVTHRRLEVGGQLVYDELNHRLGWSKKSFPFRVRRRTVGVASVFRYSRVKYTGSKDEMKALFDKYKMGVEYGLSTV